MSFEDFQEADADEWRVEWSDGRSRTTTLAAIAWRADEDEDATVEPL